MSFLHTKELYCFFKTSFSEHAADYVHLLRRVVVNRISLASEYTCIFKEGRGKDVGQLPQDDFAASADDEVVVRRGGHGPDDIWVVNERANLLVCSSVP